MTRQAVRQGFSSAHAGSVAYWRQSQLRVRIPRDTPEPASGLPMHALSCRQHKETNLTEGKHDDRINRILHQVPAGAYLRYRELLAYDNTYIQLNYNLDTHGAIGSIPSDGTAGYNTTMTTSPSSATMWAEPLALKIPSSFHHEKHSVFKPVTSRMPALRTSKHRSMQ